VSAGAGVTQPTVGSSVFGFAGDAKGGYAELAIMQAQNAIPVPETLTPEQAAGSLVGGLTATVILTEAAPISDGDSVFVPAAAGGLGAYAVQVAKLLGATVIAGAGTAEKRRAAMDLGADHAIVYTGDGWQQQLRDLTGGRGVDVALEM